MSVVSFRGTTLRLGCQSSVKSRQREESARHDNLTRARAADAGTEIGPWRREWRRLTGRACEQILPAVDCTTDESPTLGFQAVCVRQERTHETYSACRFAATLILGAGFGVFYQRDINFGDAYAQGAAASPLAAPAEQSLPEASIIDQDAPYYEACAREGLSDSECVGRLIWFKPPPVTTAFHTYNPAAAHWRSWSTGSASCDPISATIVSGPGESSNDPSCCKPAIPTARPSRWRKPMASTGVLATTCS